MCKFCEEKEVIKEFGLELNIDQDNDLAIEINRYGEEACACISINYCPMCGRKLKD